jgi:hypothetical protein
VTSTRSVLFQNASVNTLRACTCSNSKLCTSFEHLGHNLSVEISAEDVVRRYLHGLMQGRFATKTALATGMGTSRAQLQASIRQGHLTVGQMNQLAESMGSTIWGVFKELSGLAEQMEKGRIAKLTNDELAELVGGLEKRGKADREAVLQGELDRERFSVATPSRRAGHRSSGHDGHAVPRRQPQESSAQHPRRPR